MKLVEITLLFIFSVLTVILIIMGNREGTCSNESNLWESSRTHLFGSECEGTGMFVIVCILAILVQIARNVIWVKNSQATREALKMDSDKRNRRIILNLLLYTFASTALYIFSILIILGGNMFVLLCVLVGNLLGVAFSMTEQDADKERLTTAIAQLKCTWEELSSKTRTNEEEIEYKEMVEIKEWVKSWVSDEEKTSFTFKTSDNLKFL
jgi:uncharacterized membrane protein